MSYNRGLAKCATIARQLVEKHAIAILEPAYARPQGSAETGLRITDHNGRAILAPSDSRDEALIAIDGKTFLTEEAFNEALRPIVNRTVRKLRVETLGVIMCAARKDTLYAAAAADNGRSLLRQTAITLITEHVMTIIQRDYLEVWKLRKEASAALGAPAYSMFIL